MTTPVRNATQWFPPSGKGFVSTQGTLFFTDNSGNFLVTNTALDIVTTPTYVIPKIPTKWTVVGT